MFKPLDSKTKLSQIEEEMLEFWEMEEIFKKSLVQRVKNNQGKRNKKYVFFDGPPFANGLPHYGHLLAGSIKDAVTRYATMRGYYVPRVNGWDCHGLPVEYEIEKELELNGRKEVEELGVAKFNKACRESVFRYTEEWEKTIKRLGRWVDFENSYATLENNYMESIWWVFRSIWDKKMVYQDHKSMHICPRCETPLSNFEVTQGYKEITDLATVVKFEITDQKFLKKHCYDKKTSFVAWTTTPWSIPTTMGLAIGEKFEYVVVDIGNYEQIICAKNRIEYVTNHLETYKVTHELNGKDMVGINYKHPFSQYAKNEDVKSNDKIYKTHATDYVSVDDGTGIVTINGAFGEIDMEAAQTIGLPIVVNVGPDGKYDETMGQLAGKSVKPRDDSTKMDKKIAAYLKENDALLRAENYKHSYPHCWRCDSPLLNYATKAWFIRVTEIKDKLIANNKKIHWMPEHIKEGRFGKWLENVKDWNISRNRFWGCPIPIWECTECGNRECIGSIKELREKATGGNTFIFIRHGEAESNVQGITNSDPKIKIDLTDKGRDQAAKVAKQMKKDGIDLLFSSPLARAHQTAEYISEATGVELTTNQHLREKDFGKLNGAPYKEFYKNFDSPQERYKKRLEDAESVQDVEKRLADFIDYLQRTHTGKRIVIVTHGDVIRSAEKLFNGTPIDELFTTIAENAKPIEMHIGKLPMRDGELDLHKPYIDDIELSCSKCEKPMQRITEVLDCWFESGSMPYAQLHYPFENKKEFEDNFPAEFIAEGLDQTRGWFYTLHVLSTILFDKPAFKNVIVNGIILAADGEKLSKRKKNYPDPKQLFDEHGVDSTRLLLYTSNAALGGDVRFSERHVEELVKKFMLTLTNTYSFFTTYANIDGWKPKPIGNRAKGKLDRWILSEVNMLVRDVTEAMEAYNLPAATRPFLDFADNLSNWYIRRSRRRFWKSESDSDKNEAYETLHTVLVTLSQLMAPFMPFTSDFIYKELTDEESVHLSNWPEEVENAIDIELNDEMKLVRTVVALGHSIRSVESIKVRQPLSKLQIALPKTFKTKTVLDQQDVISEELNVKEIELIEDAGAIATQAFKPNPKVLGPKFGKDVQQIIKLCKEGKYEIDGDAVKVGDFTLSLEKDGEMVFEGKEGAHVAEEDGIVVSLDIEITQDLLEEGYVREIVRNLQEMRKDAGYEVSDRISVFVGSEKMSEVVAQYSGYITKETLANELQQKGGFAPDIEREIELDEIKITLGVRR